MLAVVGFLGIVFSSPTPPSERPDRAAPADPMAPSSSRSLACDFTRSFIRWRHDTLKKPLLTASQPPPTTLNNVRMPVECLLTLERDGSAIEFALGASCKTEQVFVERDVWMQPNADMCAISSADQFMVVKRWDRADKGVMLHPPSLGPQPERQAVDPRIAFETHALALRRRPVRLLEGIEETIAALASDREVVGRTVYSTPHGSCTVEYPVKTVNYSERHRYYQVDTGPVLFLGEPTGPSLVEHLHLAFVAHLGGSWAEFLVSCRTELEGHGVAVHHFGDVRRVETLNSLWLVEGG